MDGDRTGPASTAVGLPLLPSELLHEIFCRLALPEILRLGSVSRSLCHLIADPYFRRLYDLRSGSGGGWVFVYTKRPPRDSVLRGFNDLSGRWFKFPVDRILNPAVPPGEDLYFLAAAGDFFLFASNGQRQLLAVNLTTRAVRRIPASPLGPRGTSSWRRAGLKLVSDPAESGGFKFLFAELYRDRPVLFEYCSEADTWRSIEATAAQGRPTRGEGRVCLSVSESVVLCADRGSARPAVFRPRFVDNPNPVGVNSGDRLHVYGDGNVAVVKSTVVEEAGRVRVRIVTGVEVWGLGPDGREWELVSRVAEELVEGIRKPYGVMMGCLEERRGVIRVVLMSNCKGLWDLIWLSYDRGRKEWEWVPVPDSGTKGLNMAGIAVSSSFAGSRPASARL